MKIAAKILIFFFVFNAWSQIDYSNEWEDYFSYNNVKDFVHVNAKVYTLVDNAIFIYDEISGEMEKMSSVNGLSGETATSIHYNSTYDRLVIGYATGLLEVIDANGTIKISPDISNFPLASEKEISDIAEFGDRLYLSTPFAIVVYDIKNLVFGDTYFIGDGSTEVRVNEIEIFDEKIFAATAQGIYVADVNASNLIDFNVWEKYFNNSFSSIASFANEIYVSSGRQLYKFTEGLPLERLQNYASNVLKIKTSSNYISIAIQRQSNVYDTGFNLIASTDSDPDSDYYFELNVAFAENNAIYLGTKEFGILKTPLNNAGNYEEIHPDGPLSNGAFSITAQNNDLWIVYGGYNASYGPLRNRYGYSHFNGEQWTNIPYDENYPATNLVNVTIHPDDPEKVYLSSWGAGNRNSPNPTTGGLLVVESDAPTDYLNHLNSGLEEVLPDHPTYVTVRVDGTAFDDQGNFWATNSLVDDALKRMSPSGNWTGYDLTAVKINNASELNELVIDKLDNKWMGSRRSGAVVFNENGNRLLALTTEATKGSLPHLNVRSVAVDSGNRIWIGTQAGMVVFYDAAGVFDADIYDAEPIIILDDGVPKKLLGDQPINSIAVDGANNKWFGTDRGGVLQTSPNGRETLNIFNTSNSPLPSNTILKVKVDLSNGKVFFATDKGVVAFNNNIASYGTVLDEVYAYPNPVTKEHDFVTIDGRNGEHLPEGTNVKILDAAGYLVYETNVEEGQQLQGGKVVWDKRNLGGRKVASGIYIVLLTNEDSSETTSTKIAIVN